MVLRLGNESGGVLTRITSRGKKVRLHVKNACIFLIVHTYLHTKFDNIFFDRYLNKLEDRINLISRLQLLARYPYPLVMISKGTYRVAP